MKYIYLMLIVSLFLVGTASAAISELPTVKQSKCISLPQIESGSLYQNLTFIQKPDGSKDRIYKYMTKEGYSYNYTYCNTVLIGSYIVNGCSDLSCWSYRFTVTPSGSSNLLGLYLIAFIVLYGIGFFGFFGKNEWISVLGGMGMIILGVLSMTNGIDVFRNDITNTVSWITVGLGAIFALVAGVSIINDNV